MTDASLTKTATNGSRCHSSNSVTNPLLPGPSNKTHAAVSTQSRIVLDAEAASGHRHYLTLKFSEEPKPNILKILWNKESGRVRGKLSQLVSKAAISQVTQGADTSRGAGENNEEPTSSSSTYGRSWKTIGRGAYGTVSAFHRLTADGRGEELVAIKKFSRRPGQTEANYTKRAKQEFNLASKLQHVNIVRTMDLFRDEKDYFCEVMELCSGGDLFTLLHQGGQLEPEEADCFFKQLLHGVQYIHSVGLAHCDLKPENILFTAQGVLKISDFGCGHMFGLADEGNPRLMSGVRGSTPYVAPEEFRDDAFDARPVDIWACGVVYVLMRTGRFLWNIAIREKDEFYARYLEDRRLEEGYAPLEELQLSQSRDTIYCLLDPVAARRITATQALRSRWVRDISFCEI